MKKVTNKNILNEIDSPEKAWVLGWLASDATIGKNGGISLELKKSDKKVFDKIEEVLELEHAIYYRPNRPSARISFHSKQIVRDLEKIGIPSGRKSKILVPPNIPDKFMRYFWTGAWEGDGSVYTTQKSLYSPLTPGINLVGTKAICEGFKEFLNIPTKVLPNGDSFIIKRECLIPEFWQTIFQKLYDTYMVENGFILQRKYYFLKNISKTYIP